MKRGTNGRTNIASELRASGCAVCRWIDNRPSPSARISFATCNGSRTNNGAGLKPYAEERGVALMGDIPFGVSYYSADVFARPDEFALDWSGGAPPEPYFKDDKFTQKWGQNWGIPLYRWDAMRDAEFRLVAGTCPRRRTFFIFSGSITSSAFIGFTLSRGDHGGIKKFLAAGME